MKVELLYFDGCPHWMLAESRLVEALRRAGRDEPVHRVRIDAPGASVGPFSGSPTILLDGRDPFADAATATGSSCRVYLTEYGAAGSPTVEQLIEVLAE